MEHLYTTEEAAAKLKIHHETMRDYLRDRKIAGIKFGRVWRIRESDLIAFISRNLTPAKQSTQANTDSDFMAKLDAGAARIAAGTLRPITSDDISKAIADARP